MRFNVRFSILMLLLAGMLLTACSVSSGSGDATGIQVGIKDDLCPSVEVAAGDEVRWRNEGSVEHQVSAQNADGTMMFDSGALQRGDTFAFTFPEAGTINYSCSSDGSLTGTITVE